MKLIRTIFYVAFIFICFTVLGIVDFLQKQDECECNTGWKPENLKLISQVGIFIGGLNLLIPLNKSLYSIPLISSIFSILTLGVLIMYFFTMVRYFRNISNIDKCRKTCKIKKGDENFINIVSNINTVNILLISFIIGIGMLYL
jgi:hypothetical protein